MKTHKMDNHNAFVIKDIGKKKIVLSMSYKRLEFFLENIESELKAERFNGDVVVDLLPTNGLSENRFISFNFDGSKLNNAAKLKSSNTKRIQKLAFDFYSKNIDIIKNSLLTRPQKFLYLKGFYLKTESERRLTTS